MKTRRIETVIKGLRIRSQSNPQERLGDILDTHDQWRKIHFSTLRAKRLRVKWMAGLVSAALITLVITLTVTLDSSKHRPRHEGRTMAVPQYQINTAGSLQRTFRQDGLEGLERQLDRAFELYGPGPAVLAEVDLF